MTREEAADLLIESYEGTAQELEARRGRRQKPLDGDAGVIRAMLLTTSPKTQATPGEFEEAVRVLGQP